MPPSGLVGLDPAWSTLVTAVDHDGIERTWHVLDTGRRPVRGTVICVHGNPNWSYMWRKLCRSLTDWRVVAVDALNMGYSERIGESRRFAGHVSDLVAVTQAIDIEGPVVTVAHDWGGPISMGWAQEHQDMLAGIVLMNTGVARPPATKVPPLISIARSTLRATCETTPTFLHGALRMARPQLARDVYQGYSSPYGTPAMRTGIRDFVEDIPILESHPSHGSLASVAQGLDQLQDVPALLLWGAKDIVFSDAFLNDMIMRLPHADVHRYADAGHQIIEDTDAVEVIGRWLTSPLAAAGEHADADERAPIWSAIEARRGDHSPAVIEMDSKHEGKVARTTTFDELHQRVQAVAGGFAAVGITKGDRLATLVPPGIDLTVLVYACLRAGVVVVAPDAALGLDGMRRALRSSRPDYVVGDWRGLALAKTLRLPARRVSFGELLASADVASSPPSLPVEPDARDTAAIVFTSGSTGPSKGVVYTHGQLEAQRDIITEAFMLEPTDKVVVAFAPFTILAPAIGIPSVMPAMNISAPAKLRAQALGEAARAIEATIVFASPAVLGNIAATADQADADARSSLGAIRSIVTAGAPVSPRLLAEVAPVFPGADMFTPYGMTEVLPVTVASADEIAAGSASRGVCVGVPLPQVEVRIHSITTPADTLPEAVDPGATGEVWIRGQHRAAGYDRLWAQQTHAFVDGWHRSGDVGHIDTDGRLWIEGRVADVIHGPDGMLTPVGVELEAESVSGVDQAAAVAVGPVGTQQLAIVVAGPSTNSGVVAEPAVAAAVRSAVTADVAAVLVAPSIPVDRRHNSKIDRARVKRWVEAVLSGAPRARL